MELLTNLVTNQQAEFLKVPLRMRPANCRSPGIGSGAGKRISGPRRFEARGQAGRSGDARRWLVRAAPGAWRTQSIPAVRVIFRTPTDATRLTCLGNERAIPAYFLTPTEQIATGQNRYGIINHPVRLN